MRNLTVPLLLISGYVLSGCSSQAQQEATLRDLDVQSSEIGQAPVFVKPKSEEEIRQAYDNYLRNAGTDERGRRVAMGRLAELEMEKLKELENKQTGPEQTISDTQQRASLQKTIA